MGKKSDKSSKEKPIVQNTEEISNKTPEPYQCVGNFASDFTELVREQNLGFQIPIIVLNKRVISPAGVSADANINLLTVKKGNRDDKKPQSVMHQIDSEQLPPEEKEIINLLGFKPRSLVIKPTLSALKPVIFIESDNIEKVDNVTEISIRRWKVDLQILDLLRCCFSSVTRLSTITFWRVGLTSDAVTVLSEILAKCDTIKSLTIENNEEAIDENYYELLKSDSNLTKLHLRYCNITPKGTKKIADELGSLSSQGNTKLLVLDLSGCRLGDFGAMYLMKALRINRSLLSLSMNNCDIGDDTCEEMAKSLSQYVLSDEEIFCRRQMMSERNFAEASKSVSPPASRRGDSKDRPGSVRSTSKEDKNKKDKGTTSRLKKDVKDEKHDKNLSKGKKEDKTQGSKKVSAAIADISKNTKMKGGRSPKHSKLLNQLDAMSDSISENLDNIHPLLNKAESVEPGKLLMPGNYVLLMLNLSRNRITEEGLESLDAAISYQTSHMSQTKVNGTGLLKLTIQSNKFEESNETYQKIQQVLLNRFQRSKSPNMDIE